MQWFWKGWNPALQFLDLYHNLNLNLGLVRLDYSCRPRPTRKDDLILNLIEPCNISIDQYTHELLFENAKYLTLNASLLRQSFAPCFVLGAVHLSSILLFPLRPWKMTSSTKVKSWVHTTAGYPETLKLAETELSPTPASGHILIQVRAAALNPVDIQLMNFPLYSLPYLNGPKTAGRDFAGVVLAAGEDTHFKKGEEVFGISMAMNGTGSLTELADIDLKAGATFIKKPRNLSWPQAASLPLVYLTARTVIERCRPYMKASTPWENKLVVLGGSSATGIYTVEIANSLGWTILASCSGRNADFVKGLGASQVVDYTTSPTAVVDAVKKFSPNAIADCVGGTECIGLAPQYVTIVGDKISRSSMGGPAIYLTHPRMLLRWLFGYLGLGSSYECVTLDARKEWLEETTKLNPESDIIIDSVFDFERAKEAFERLNTGRARGKVVVEIKDS